MDQVNHLENIPNFYRGKSILITGATGFLAKILVSKLIDSCPDFKCIYLLIRGKKSQKLQDRLMKEVINTECIQMVLDRKPHLKQSLISRIVPIAGDLVQEGIGLKPADHKMVTEDVDIIVSCAASVYFTEPLQSQLEINFYGPMRLMQLAHECKKTPAFVHVSTMYVNSNLPQNTRIYEKIYDDSIPGDPEEVAARIMALSPSEAVDQEKSILGNFHSTYTYTKHLAEKVLMKRRGNIPFAITRPAIIISCIRDPAPGWNDTIAAAAVVIFTIGNGQKHVSQMGNTSCSDLIPADFCCNAIILAAVVISMNPAKPIIYNSATSGTNLIKIRDFFVHILRAVQYNKYEKQARSPFHVPIHDRKLYEFFTLFDLNLQVLPYQILNSIPFIANDQLSTGIQQAKKGIAFLNMCYDQLEFFMNYNWYYDATELVKVSDSLSPAMRQIFPVDPKEIDWRTTCESNILGMQKFYSLQDDPVLHHGYKQLLKRNQLPWFYSPRLMINRSYNVIAKSTNELFPKVLNNSKFQEYLKLNSNQLSSEYAKVALDPRKIQLDSEKAKQTFKRLSCSVSTKTIVPLFSLMNVINRRAFDGLFMQEAGFEKVQSLIQQGDKVILMPTYKSFADSFILTNLFLIQNMDIPLTMGCFEDTPRFQLYDSFLGKMGYVLNQRNQNQSIQDNYINAQLLAESVNKYPVTIVYQNDIRLRSGKFSQPTKGDTSVNWVLHAYNQMQDKKKLHIVPVSINYDRLLEMKILAVEMVSGVNPNMSLSELLQKLKAFNNNQLGKCTVKFLDPVNVSAYMSNFNNTLTNNSVAEISHKLTDDLYRDQSNCAYVTLNMMIASLLLQEKRSSVSVKDLTKKCRTLWTYLKQNKVATLMTRDPQPFTITNNVKGLGFAVKQQGKDEMILLDAKNDMRTMLSLSYYSISLFSHRVVEAFLAVVIKTHYKKSSEPLTMDKVVHDYKSLNEIFKNEFVLRDASSFEQRFNERIQSLAAFGEIQYDGADKTIRPTKNAKLINFFSEIGFYLLETYHVVLFTVELMRSKNLRVNMDKLVEQIHEALKELHNIQVVRNLHACLDETIRLSLTQYGNLGFAQIETFINIDGTRNTFISVPQESELKINEKLDLLTVYLSYEDEAMNQVEEEITKALEAAQIIHLARL